MAFISTETKNIEVSELVAGWRRLERGTGVLVVVAYTNRREFREYVLLVEFMTCHVHELVFVKSGIGGVLHPALIWLLLRFVCLQQSNEL